MQGLSGPACRSRDSPPSRILALAAGYLDASVSAANVQSMAPQQYQLGAYARICSRYSKLRCAAIAYQTKEWPILLADIKPGMVVAHAILATSGAVVVSAGQARDPDVFERLQRFIAAGAIETLSATIEDHGDAQVPPD